MKRRLRRYVDLLRGRDRGTVAITFLLSFPILLTVVGVLVQYALLANAKLTVDRAAAAAARAAMTSLPTDPAIEGVDGPGNVNKAAWLVLGGLSPAAPGTTAEGVAVAAAMRRLGLAVPDRFANRYAYAQGATVVQIDALEARGAQAGVIDYPRAAAPRVRITVSYPFRLTVPLVGPAIGQKTTVAGVTGRFMTLQSSLDVQLSDGREVPTNMYGEP
jgi:hypothetical protein